MKRVLLLLLLAAFAVFPAQAGRHSRGSSRHDVHVRSYSRQGRTYVHSHERVATGHGVHRSSSGHSRSSYSSSRSYHAPRPHSSYHAPSHRSSTHGSHRRSQEARGGFQREHPCPSTGKRSGRCPGYVVDHVKALACGGADDPSNMQWQTVAAAKAKDKTERIGCR